MCVCLYVGGRACDFVLLLQVAGTQNMPIFIGILQQLAAIDPDGLLCDSQWKALGSTIKSFLKAEDSGEIEVHVLEVQSFY